MAKIIIDEFVVTIVSNEIVISHKKDSKQVIKFNTRTGSIELGDTGIEPGVTLKILGSNFDFQYNGGHILTLHRNISEQEDVFFDFDFENRTASFR